MRALTLLLALLATPALAQVAARMHGTILEVQPDRMQVRTETGPVTVMLPANVRIGASAERSLASIKPGEFVGSAAMPGRDGVLHAQEVHIFPDSLRGVGEGHRPMDQPGQTMTNATVDGIAEVTGGHTLHLRYPGGEQTIEVDPDVPVIELIVGDRSFLVPGAQVTIRATRDGETLTAASIEAERNGVKPQP